MKSAELEKRKKQLLALRDRLTGTLRHVEEAAREDVQKGGEISGYHTHLADADEEGLDKEIAIAQNEEGILELVEERSATDRRRHLRHLRGMRQADSRGTARSDSIHAVLRPLRSEGRIVFAPAKNFAARPAATSVHSGSDDWCDHQRSTAARPSAVSNR